LSSEEEGELGEFAQVADERLDAIEEYSESKPSS
jgi:hypothetical protein